MKKVQDKIRRKIRRKKHIRKDIRGTEQRPRVTVFRSNQNLYVQVIDDDSGRTLASVSTLEKEYSSLKSCVSDAEKIGEAMGERLKAKSISSVVFDRNGYKYHGVIKAVADGVRKQGIKF